MNILIACNEKYLNLAKYMLFSLFEHNGQLNVYLIYEDISENSISKFKSFFQKFDIGCLNLIKFDSSQIELPLKDDSITGHITKEAYFRLYAPFFLPDDMERILYLDCDIICADSISDFYNTDFNNNILVGCLNTDLANCEYLKRLGLPNDHVYINSGVLLFNLKKYKEFVSIEKLNRFIVENAGILDFQDQDVVNKMFVGNILYGDVYYNFQIGMLLYTEGGKLIHYTGPIKPWNDEFSRPFLAKPYYAVLEKLGEYDLLEHKIKMHRDNFKKNYKIATVFVDGDFVTEELVEEVLAQLETRVEFIISYNDIEKGLIDKYCELDCRVEFVCKEELAYYSQTTGAYFIYFDINEFKNMDLNFIREICHFIDIENLAIVFYKDFKLHKKKTICDNGVRISGEDAIKLIDDNAMKGYRAIHFANFNEIKDGKYGYWGE